MIVKLKIGKTVKEGFLLDIGDFYLFTVPLKKLGKYGLSHKIYKIEKDKYADILAVQ